MPTTTLRIGHRVTIDLTETAHSPQGTREGVVIWTDDDLVGVDCGPSDDEFWIESHGREGYGVRRAQIVRIRRPTAASREQADTVRRLHNLDQPEPPASAPRSHPESL